MSVTTSRSPDIAIRKKIRNTTRRKCCPCHAEWHGRSPKCCACYETCNESSENVAKVLRLPHKTIFDSSWNMLECHKVSRLPRKTTLQPVWKPSTRRGFAASPIDTATPQENQRLETRHGGASKRAFRARRLQLFTLRSFKIDAFPLSFLTNRPHNRHFVQGVRRFSSHVTKCHCCHGICMLPPLRAALTLRFAKTRNTIRLKCCACHAKWHWRSPKCCACHEKYSAS